MLASASPLAETGRPAKRHKLFLPKLRSPEEIDWSLAVVDGVRIGAARGGEHTGPAIIDRGRPGSKHHVIVDVHGVPLEVQLSAANKPDVRQLVPLLANLPQVIGKVGHPQSRPKAIYGDRGYDSEQVFGLLGWLGIKPCLAKAVDAT